MTVPNLGPLDIISEAWVDAVADQLNDLPPAIQYGSNSATSDAVTGDMSVVFPVAFASPPTVIVSPGINTNLQRTLLITAITSTGFTVRATSNDALDLNANYVIQWVAIGVLP